MNNKEKKIILNASAKQHWSCLRKKKYTKAEARKKSEKQSFDFYKCKYCGKYHLTKKKPELTWANYHSREANIKYLSVSQYKDFAGTLGKRGCEARAMAKLRGEWEEEPTTAMLVGSYVDAYFEGKLENFKLEYPEIFKKDGNLKSDYIKAEEIIKRIERDELFMLHLSGKKQVIKIAEMFGAKWKFKMDSYFPKKLIVDLKIIKDLHERFWVKDLGHFTDFVSYWGYDVQLAVYQELERILTGNKIPVLIAACDKGKEPEIELIGIRDRQLDFALSEVKENIPRILALKQGKIQPDRCNICDYCKATKKLTGIIYSEDLTEI